MSEKRTALSRPVGTRFEPETLAIIEEIARDEKTRPARVIRLFVENWIKSSPRNALTRPVKKAS